MCSPTGVLVWGDGYNKPLVLLSGVVYLANGGCNRGRGPLSYSVGRSVGSSGRFGGAGSGLEGGQGGELSVIKKGTIWDVVCISIFPGSGVDLVCLGVAILIKVGTKISHSGWEQVRLAILFKVGTKIYKFCWERF